MSKRLVSLVILLAAALNGFLGCAGDAEKQRESQRQMELQKIQDEINANNQTIASIEVRLQMLKESFSQNVQLIENDLQQYKQRNQALNVAVSSIKGGEETTSEKAQGGLPGWLEFLIIIVIIVAALLLLLYLMRPKPVEDEDFDDLEDFEDFESEESEKDNSETDSEKNSSEKNKD
ncbi:MAG: hypothetical protein Kow0059_09110 [Candidatus Sumerlaeia bacterium]